MDKTKLAVDLFDDFAQVYQEKFMNLELYRDVLDLFCQNVQPQGAEVLELACGPGNITRYLLDRRPDLRILGTDLAPRMLELARANNPAARFELLDCRNASQLQRRFDGVVCGFGLPYLSKTEALDFIADMAEVLQPGGWLYLSTMEDDYEKSDWKGPSSGGDRRLFQYFHEAGYLTDALRQNGFEIADLRRKTYPAPDGSMTTDLLILAQLVEK